MALLGALKVAVGETSAVPGDLRHPAIEQCLQDILRVSQSVLPKARVTNEDDADVAH